MHYSLKFASECMCTRPRAQIDIAQATLVTAFTNVRLLDFATHTIFPNN